MKDEREIDIIDLLLKVAAKWRVILVWIIVCGVLITGVAVGKAVIDKNDANIDKQMAKTENAIQLAKDAIHEEDDSEKLLANAENAYESYKILSQRQKQEEDYMKKSLYYNLNANRITKVEITYAIDNHYEVTYPIVDSYNNLGDIMNTYTTSIKSIDVSNAVISGMEWNTEHKYVQELITAAAPTNGLFKITVIYDNEQDAAKIAEIIEAQMTEITKTVKANYGKVDCTLQSVQTDTSVNTDISNAQKAEWDAYVAYQTQKDKLEENLKSKDKDYFKALIGADKVKRAAEEEQEDASLLWFISKKLIAIGLAIGFIIPVGFYVVMYVLKDTVKTVDELETTVGATVFGTFLLSTKKSEKRNFIFDKWIAKGLDAKATKLDVENSSAVIASSIEQVSKVNECKDVCLVSTDALTTEMIGIKEVIAKLDAAGVKYALAGNVLSDATSIKTMNEASGLILVEKVGVIRHRDLKRELDFIEAYKAKVLGCIAMQDKTCK